MVRYRTFPIGLFTSIDFERYRYDYRYDDRKTINKFTEKITFFWRKLVTNEKSTIT